MTRYDPGIIQHYADQLYSQANRLIFLCTVIGAIAGLVGGFFCMQFFHSDAHKIVLIVGLVLGAFVGVIIGVQRAFWHKLQAQLALCQMMTELNTRRAAQNLAAPVGGGFPEIQP